MAAPSYSEVESRLQSMAVYIDRLYKSITFNGVTCGLLMSSPGMPVWAEIKRRLYSDTTGLKCKSLWNGSGNDSPLSGWRVP